NIRTFEEKKVDLCYGLLVKRYAQNVVDATEEQIDMAVKNRIPGVIQMFFDFGIMVGAGIALLGIFLFGFYQSAR
ncbi:cytochrome bd-I ubiquinol oxidase subunit CydA, partial [Psychromonas aquatilis]